MKLKSILHGMDRVSEWSGKIFIWLIIPLTVIVVLEVISRRILNAPHVWSTEVISYLYGTHFMLVAAYALLYKSHVNIDLLFQQFTPRWQGIAETFNYVVFFFPFCFIIFQQGCIYAADSWQMHETSQTAALTIVPLIKTTIPLTFLLLLIQGIANFIRSIYLAVKGQEL
ncbi:MAG: TRAP transporter small permease subunit [Desulfobacterales bacterium]|nr:MAG: TRAP transporter small permease subunit [Desulfobacterales bacterium]